jgi:hypothetical protein
MGFSLSVLVLLGVCIGGMLWQKSLGAKASSAEYVDVDLPLDIIVAVGGRATSSVVGRVLNRGAAPAEPDGAGGASWRARSKGGVLVMRVVPDGGGRGYRVSGWAEELAPAQYGTGFRSGFLALSFAVTNRLYAALGVPHAPLILIRQRKRAFRALTREAG